MGIVKQIIEILLTNERHKQYQLGREKSPVLGSRIRTAEKDFSGSFENDKRL